MSEFVTRFEVEDRERLLRRDFDSLAADLHAVAIEAHKTHRVVEALRCEVLLLWRVIIPLLPPEQRDLLDRERRAGVTAADPDDMTAGDDSDVVLSAIANTHNTPQHHTPTSTTSPTSATSHNRQVVDRADVPEL